MKKSKNRISIHSFDLENSSIKLPEKIQSEAKKLISYGFEKYKPKSSYEISVIFTSNNYIKKLNKQYLGKDYATDVLCFPYSTGKHFTADIFVSVEKAYEYVTSAQQNNQEFTQELNTELLFLVSHGILHLFGWKDNTEENRRKMWNKQKELLRLCFPGV